MAKSVIASDLNNLLAGDRWPGILLHILPGEHPRRLPGAKTACVHEVSFLDQVAAAGASLGTPLVIYDEGSLPFARDIAIQKLTLAGYTQVSVLEGGLTAWADAGFAIEDLSPPQAEQDSFHGRFHLNTVDSVIRWTGRNLFNHHEGTVRLSDGHAIIERGQVKSAVFTINMRSVACADLVDQGLNAMLLRHLADADFFHTARFPTADFWLGQAQEIPGALPGNPNYRFTGLFRLRGVTQEISFDAVVAPNGADRLTAQAQLEIDRTRWGVLYGSTRFFNFLGKHVVNDIIHLHLKIHLDRAN